MQYVTKIKVTDQTFIFFLITTHEQYILLQNNKTARDDIKKFQLILQSNYDREITSELTRAN